MDYSSQQGTKTAPVTVWEVQPQNLPLFPATWRDKHNRLLDPQQQMDEFLSKDLLTTRFTQIKHRLWLAGRLLPPRPLHTQQLMCRDIVITEQVEFHLVWAKGKIFIKPLPRYLLDPAFRERCLADTNANRHLARCARGLLHSYTALVASESDFRIAREKGLLPSDLSWPAWHALVRAFITHPDIYNDIDERYLYGELRLSRLNKISRFTSARGLLYGYAPELATSEYSDFFANNFGAVVAILGYLVIVLTAMQVGLGVKDLSDNSAFNWVCYVFTVFSLLAPLVAAAVIFAVFLFMLIDHLLRTTADQKKRQATMRIQPASDSTTV